MSGPNQHPRRDLPDSYFNWNLRNARVGAGYTLRELAKEVGITPASINFYERLRMFPNPTIARKIAHALGRELDYLFPENLRGVAHEVRLGREISLGEEDAQFSSLDDVDKNDLTGGENPERMTVRNELLKSVENVLCDLSYREREILKLKYCIGGGYRYTGEEMGRIFKISRQGLGEIERRAIRKLRDIRRAERLRDFLDAG